MHLLIIGDGGKRFRSKLVKQAIDLGLERRVQFHGYADDPMPFIRKADLVLVCSRWEAFGRVAVEAMLAGRPLIGSARGATPELIQHGETGLIYDWGNAAQLADRIQYLYDNPTERVRLGAAAQKWAESRFTQERYAREVFNVLSELVPSNIQTGSLLQSQTMNHPQ